MNTPTRNHILALTLVTAAAVGCSTRPSDFAGVTKSRLRLLEHLGKSALEKQKSLEGISSITDFLDLMKVEAEGTFKQDETDEWSRPFLVVPYISKELKGILFVSLGTDVNDTRDDLRLWLLMAQGDGQEVVVSRSWDIR